MRRLVHCDWFWLFFFRSTNTSNRILGSRDGGLENLRAILISQSSQCRGTNAAAAGHGHESVDLHNTFFTTIISTAPGSPQVTPPSRPVARTIAAAAHQPADVKSRRVKRKKRKRSTFVWVNESFSRSSSNCWCAFFFSPFPHFLHSRPMSVQAGSRGRCAPSTAHTLERTLE